MWSSILYKQMSVYKYEESVGKSFGSISFCFVFICFISVDQSQLDMLYLPTDNFERISCCLLTVENVYVFSTFTLQPRQIHSLYSHLIFMVISNSSRGFQSFSLATGCFFAHFHTKSLYLITFRHFFLLLKRLNTDLSPLTRLQTCVGLSSLSQKHIIFLVESMKNRKDDTV